MLFIVATIFVTVRFVFSTLSQIEVFLTFSSGSSLPMANFSVSIFCVFAAFITTLSIAYYVGLFRLRRWTLPILLFSSVSLLVLDMLAITLGNYGNTLELIISLVGLVIVICIGYGAWVRRASFVGSARKLWLQIPILILLSSAVFLSILAQIYTDDRAIHDEDLLLPNMAILSKSDNAHFALPSIVTLSPEKKSAFDRTQKYYRSLEQGEHIDIDAASTTLAGLATITDQFIEASKKPRYQCPSSVNMSRYEAEQCPLAELRSMAQIVALRSYVEASHGDTKAALESAYAPARLSKLIDSAQPHLLEHLVAIALVKISVESVEHVVTQATTSLSAETSSAIARELETYKFDGSTLEMSLKGEYMSLKKTLYPFERFSGYALHYNRTNNELALLTRQNIETARAQCGSNLEQKTNAVTAYINTEMQSPLLWTLIKPNGIGATLKRVSMTNSGGVRKKECGVNEINDSLLQRLAGK